MRPLLPSPEPPSWRESALWSFSLGTLFFLVYGGTNWITSLRLDVGTLYFEWERMIPFVPTLIIPYMSIDLFFAASPFLCTTRGELQTLAKRAIFAILISAACFLAFPLRFAFDRPEVNGSLGKTFTLLTLFDRPFNLLPSLHISLLAIIWVVYRSHTRGILRAACGWWFSLIALSTVLTYQHHVLDAIAGLIVAMLDFHVFPERRDGRLHTKGVAIAPPHLPFAGWHQGGLGVGARYALLALCFLYGARTALPWTLSFLWPATTFALMSSAYFGAGAIVFRKSDGRLPRVTWILLAPYLWGAHLSLACYRRNRPAYAEIAPGILIGRRLSEAESKAVIRRGVRAVLDLTTEYSETQAFLRLHYWNLQVLDLTVPTPEQLDEAIAFTRRQRSLGAVYIHCALGYSRSACVAVAYLLAEGLAGTVSEAIQRIRIVRPEIVLQSDLLSELTRFRPDAEEKASGGRSVLVPGDALTGGEPMTARPAAADPETTPLPNAGSVTLGPWELLPPLWPTGFCHRRLRG